MGQSLVGSNYEEIQAAINKVEALKAKEEATLQELNYALQQLRPIEPLEPESVIRFTRYAGYTYVALRATEVRGKGIWYFTQDPDRTGGNKLHPGDWDHVLSVVGQKNWNTLEVLG